MGDEAVRPASHAVAMIVGVMVARNEADRYLVRAVQNIVQYCDAVVFVDDGSTDETVERALQYGDGRLLVTRYRDPQSTGFWTADEAPIREFAWRLATAQAGPDGWIYVADADHELIGISPEEFRALCQSDTANSWAFPLYDCWDTETQMRVDGFWQAHRYPRPWLARAMLQDFAPTWERQDIHVGHLPTNYPFVTGEAPVGGIRHLGYINPDERLTKLNRYRSLGHLAQGGRLTDVEAAHAESIATVATLAPVPGFEAPTRILVGSVVRKPLPVLHAFLQTLLWQQVRKKSQIGFVFLPNYAPSDPDVPACLDLLRSVPGSHVLEPVVAPEGDYGEGSQTRQWTGPAFGRLAELKDRLIQMALTEQADYLWLVDADVLNDPFTLQSLLDSEAGIVAGVYWTQWQRIQPDSTERVHAGPQVWLRHPYHLDGRGWTESEFRSALVNRARIQVGGLGANTLFRKDVLVKGVNFAHFGALAPGPMSEGEDRHLCARAESLHCDLVADAWPDVWHAYHPHEYDTIPQQLERLSVFHVKQASYGDLVSVKLRMLEPVPDGAGRMLLPGPQWVRGRVGSLKTLPQIEELVTNLPVGERTILKVAFPSHYPYEPLRGQSRLMEVALLDAKPYRLPPVIDREMLVGERSGVQADATTLTAAQIGGLV